MSVASIAGVKREYSASELTERVKQAGLDAGFHLVGIAALAPASHPQEFSRWYAAGSYKPLAHIFEQNDARLNPPQRHPWAKSVVSLAHQYDEKGVAEPAESQRNELASLTWRPHLPSKPGCDDLDPEGWQTRSAKDRSDSSTIISRSPALGVWPWIARYERDANYHRINDGAVELFLKRLNGAVGEPVRAQEVMEHSTFFERDLAYQSGLGWVGKNNMIIHPRLGSFFVLTNVFLDLNLVPDPVVVDHCGTCTLCLDSCPTGALDGPRNIIIEKCLTTRSVDIGGSVPDDFLAPLSGHLSGCDICQNACPFNSESKGNPRRVGPPPDRWRETTIIDLIRCNDAERLTYVSGSLLARIPTDILKRNAVLVGARILRIAAGEQRREDLDYVASEVNLSDLPALTAAIREQLDSPFEAVRDAAAYALQFSPDHSLPQ